MITEYDYAAYREAPVVEKPKDIKEYRHIAYLNGVHYGLAYERLSRGDNEFTLRTHNSNVSRLEGVAEQFGYKTGCEPLGDYYTAVWFDR